MKDEAKTKKQLSAELVELRQRLTELEAVEIERKQAEERLQDSIRQMKIAYEQATICTHELSEELAERKRIQEVLARRTQEMEALYETSLAINAQPNLSRLLHAIVRRAAKLLGMRRGGLFLMRPDGESLELVAVYNQRNDRLGTILRLGEGLAGRIAQNGEPLLVADYERWPGRADTSNLDPVGRILGVPLKQGKQVIGVLNIFDDEKTGEFGADDVRLLALFAAQASTAIGNARLLQNERTTRERLQTLSQRLVEVQETERRAIAHELHDEIGQALTGLKLLLEMVAKLPADTDEGRTRLSRAQALNDQIMTQVHDLSLDLRPPMLDDLGLLPTLLWYFERYMAQTDVKVCFKHRGMKGRRFATAVETAAYRIVQEALTNVARHAHVHQVTVRVSASAKTLQMQIVDQGASFDPAAIVTDGRHGLNGMQERAALLGGRLEVEATIGVGTQIMAELPLTPHPTEGKHETP